MSPAALKTLRCVVAVLGSLLAHWIVGGHDATMGLLLFLAAFWLTGKIWPEARFRQRR